jgi:hypothetical protein
MTDVLRAFPHAAEACVDSIAAINEDVSGFIWAWVFKHSLLRKVQEKNTNSPQVGGNLIGAPCNANSQMHNLIPSPPLPSPPTSRQLSSLQHAPPTCGCWASLGTGCKMPHMFWRHWWEMDWGERLWAHGLRYLLPQLASSLNAQQVWCVWWGKEGGEGWIDAPTFLSLHIAETLCTHAT